MRDLRERVRDDAGFTLVELLVAMVLGMIVSFAVLTTLENFSSNASRQSRVTDANSQVRDVMDRVVGDLRQARAIEVAGPNDLVYTVIDSATQTRRERICLDSSGYLWRASVKTAGPPLSPIAANTACPTPGSGAGHITSLISKNSASNPIFGYDSATPGSVRSVGMTFALSAGNAGHDDSSTLRASAFMRAKSEAAPAVTPDDIDTVCGVSGPVLTLNSDIGVLLVEYFDLDGKSLGHTSSGSALQLPEGASTVVATVTSAAGGVTQLLKSLAC